ncbi:MAG: flagellar motor switch protein FliG [Lentisphaeria bacterium]|nr:flagellar motor switch protein FliG [Lentisphaeria bacterium]NQZ70575.1 flagellar motor switch protein FliG [Lentisphaeria bacterium]
MENLSTIKKIAVILASIDREISIRILRTLPPNYVQKITAEIRMLGEITQEMSRQSFFEMAEQIEVGVNPVGGEDLARSLLQEVMGEDDAAAMLYNAPEDRTEAFAAIRKVNGKDLANILSKEQPSTVSIILAFMPSRKAGEVMVHFDEDFKEEIVTRLAQRRRADPQIVKSIERIFVDKVISLIHSMKESDTDYLGGPQYVAEMFQYMDRDESDQMMESLTEMSGELADEVRDLMFTFDDILYISDPDIQKILREVPMEKLQVALRGASTELFDKITNNLSKRARENLVEEMDLAGKIKKKDVESEQRNVVAAVRALEASGEIQLGTGGEEDSYV